MGAKIAFLSEDFATSSPAQQLLDRFLIGYPRDGSFHRIPNLEVSAYQIVSSESDFGSRRDDFRRIDWNVYARLDELTIRLTEPREDIGLYVILDCSSSMTSGAGLKSQRARQLARYEAHLYEVVYTHEAS